MPIARVQLPDGRVARFEVAEGTSPEEVEAQAQELVKTSEPKPDSGLGHKLKLFGSDILKGLASLPAMAADYGINTIPGGMGTMAPAPPIQPGPLASKALQASMTTPNTPAEQWQSAATQGAAGALVGPGGLSAPLRTAFTGGMSGLGAKAGGDMGGPLAALLGGVLGGGMASLATGTRGTKEALSREVLESTTEADLRKAAIFMEQAKQAGMPVNLSQAMPKSTNLDEMIAALSKSRHGKMTAAMLHGQPGAAATSLDMEIQQLPGQVQSWQGAANAAQTATSNVMANVKGARTALVEPLYKGAGNLGSKAPKELSSTIDRFVNSAGVSPKVAQEALALKEELLKSSINGAPRTNAQDIKAAIDSFRGGIKRTQNPLNPKEQGEMKFLVDQLSRQLATKSPLIGTANRLYSDVSRNVVDPLKKSVVGRLAGAAGAQPDKEAVASRVKAVFDAGTLPGSKTSDILTLERSLRGSGQQQVFQDVAKTWLADKLSTAAKQSGGRPSEGTAAAIESAFMADGKSRQGLTDVLVALARSKGLPDDSLQSGMKHMLSYVAAAARRPGPVAGTSPAELAQASRSGALRSAGNFTVLQPFRQVAKRLNDALNADAYSFMDRALNTPEGVELLIKMGKLPPHSPAASQALATFLGTAAGKDAGQE